MFNNELVLKSIARRVFPDMGSFSPDRTARIGLWDAHLRSTRDSAWLTIYLGPDLLFQIELRGNRLKATYALPAVMELGDGEKEYGTAWANSRRWRVDGWDDVPRVSMEIGKFFDNIEEFLEEETKVYRILERAE